MNKSSRCSCEKSSTEFRRSLQSKSKRKREILYTHSPQDHQNAVKHVGPRHVHLPRAACLLAQPRATRRSFQRGSFPFSQCLPFVAFFFFFFFLLLFFLCCSRPTHSDSHSLSPQTIARRKRPNQSKKDAQKGKRKSPDGNALGPYCNRETQSAWHRTHLKAHVR